MAYADEYFRDFVGVRQETAVRPGQVPLTLLKRQWPRSARGL